MQPFSRLGCELLAIQYSHKRATVQLKHSGSQTKHEFISDNGRALNLYPVSQ